LGGGGVPCTNENLSRSKEADEGGGGVGVVVGVVFLGYLEREHARDERRDGFSRTEMD